MDDLEKLQGNSSTLHKTLCIISKLSVNSNWSYSLETFNLGQNLPFFVLCDLEIWWMTFKNNRAPLLCCLKLCASFHRHQWIHTGVTVRKLLIWVKIGNFFSPVWPSNLMDDIKNNRAPLLCYVKLCASFQSHRWIQTRITVWKRSTCVKIGNFLSRATLKFDRWPSKTIGHLSYVASSFVHHFIAISEFKLKLQSGNAQFGSKSVIFCHVWL